MHSFETKWINPYMLPDKTPEFEKECHVSTLCYAP